MDNEVPFDWEKHRREVKAALEMPVYKPVKSRASMDDFIADEFRDLLGAIAFGVPPELAAQMVGEQKGK